MSRKDNDIKPPIYYRLKELLTEQRNPNTNRIDLATPREIVEMIHREDLTVAEKVGTRLDQIALAVEWVSESLRSGGRLLYFGAGTSGRLGVLDAAECPPTFGTPPHLVQGFIAGGPEAMFKAREGVEDSADSGRDAVADVNAQSPDVVCGLAASGRTPWVAGALKEAAKRGCRTLAVITVPEKQARLSADLIIDIPVGPEPLTGSTRMKSATAQKMVLNMITTGAMIRQGKVYENVMVDLMLTNQKLEERAKRILMHFTSLSYSESEDLLKKAKGNVKTAIIMHFGGLNQSGASALLDKEGGFVRKALESLPNHDHLEDK